LHRESTEEEKEWLRHEGATFEDNQANGYTEETTGDDFISPEQVEYLRDPIWKHIH
jgi:hypothetical protein